MSIKRNIRTKDYALISIALVSLILVRAFEYFWFYDPLMCHFSDHGVSSYKFISINYLKWSAFSSLRFLINGLLCSLIILSLSDLDHGRKYFQLYSGFLPIILLLNLIVLTGFDQPFLLFYSRRLLIQPIIGFVLVGSFYYTLSKKS